MADRVFTMSTKLLFLGAVIFSFLASKTEDLLFVFLAVYLSTLTISVFFFKREQKQHAKREEEHSPLP
jgi:L-asparagine transporter-like permease